MGINPLIKNHTAEYFLHSSVTPIQQAIEDIVTNGLNYDPQQRLSLSSEAKSLQFHLELMDYQSGRFSEADILFDDTEGIMSNTSLTPAFKESLLAVIPDSFRGAVELYRDTL